MEYWFWRNWWKSGYYLDSYLLQSCQWCWDIYTHPHTPNNVLQSFKPISWTITSWYLDTITLLILFHADFIGFIYKDVWFKIKGFARKQCNSGRLDWISSRVQIVSSNATCWFGQICSVSFWKNLKNCAAASFFLAWPITVTTPCLFSAMVQTQAAVTHPKSGMSNIRPAGQIRPL